MSRVIAVFTSIRSEYGVLKPVLQAINNEETFCLELIVAGAHLSKKYGFTVEKIIKDGFTINERIDFITFKNNVVDIPRSLSILTERIGNYFIENKVDMLLLLGDRFELLPVASMALVNNISIAHLSGGEVTTGAIDNQVRNAISKMAHLHFVGTSDAKKNLIQMTEEPWRVKEVGEPFLDIVKNFIPIEKQLIYNELSLNRDKGVIIITFHPDTILNEITPQFIMNFIDSLIKKYDLQLLVTASNFDPGGDEINDCLEKIALKTDDITFIKSLGQEKYYSMIQHSVAVVGNSSSGIIEVQSFNKPVLNIGKRQMGRLANLNVYTVNAIMEEAIVGFEYMLTDSFKDKFYGKPNIYGDGSTAEKIIKSLKEIEWDRLLLKK